MQRREFLDLAAAPLLFVAFGTSPRASSDKSVPYRLATGCPVADPFCAKRKEGWYLVGTQHARGVELRQSSLFFSPDLREWRDLGPVLVRPAYEGIKANYWAPEFVELRGKFYFYYTSDSFGDPERRFVRVATADRMALPTNYSRLWKVNGGRDTTRYFEGRMAMS